MSLNEICFKKIAVVLLGCCLVLSAHKAMGQVSISPTSLFFDSQNRFASLTVSNGGEQAQEISISTEFGYPGTLNGNLMIIRDSTMAETKSIAPWMKIFPQSFVLQSNQRQVVRFVIQPPQNLDPGGYWSRVRITSNPVSPPVETIGENQVGAQINLEVAQIISAHFRTRNAETGIEITGVEIEDDNGTRTVSVSTRQTGNTPFLGTLQLEVSGPDGKTVYQTQTALSVYTTITRSFQMNTVNWPRGKYTVRGTISSERRDINRDDLLKIEPVNFNHTFTLE